MVHKGVLYYVQRMYSVYQGLIKGWRKTVERKNKSRWIMGYNNATIIHRYEGMNHAHLLRKFLQISWEKKTLETLGLLLKKNMGGNILQVQSQKCQKLPKCTENIKK